MATEKQIKQTTEEILKRALKLSIMQREKNPMLQNTTLASIVSETLDTALKGTPYSILDKIDREKLRQRLIDAHTTLIDDQVKLILKGTFATPQEWQDYFTKLPTAALLSDHQTNLVPKIIDNIRRMTIAHERVDYIINHLGGKKEVTTLFEKMPQVILILIGAITPPLNNNERLSLLNGIIHQCNVELKLPDTYEAAEKMLLSPQNRETQPTTWKSANTVKQKTDAFIKLLETKVGKEQFKDVFKDHSHVAIMLVHLRNFERDDNTRINILKCICEKNNVDLAFPQKINEAEQRLILYALKQECNKLSNDLNALEESKAYSALNSLNTRITALGAKISNITPKIHEYNKPYFKELSQFSDQLAIRAQSLLSMPHEAQTVSVPRQPRATRLVIGEKPVKTVTTESAANKPLPKSPTH